MAISKLLASPWLRPLMPPRFRGRVPVVPVVRLTGPIGGVVPMLPGLALAGVATVLERAFAVEDAAAVAIIVNSPGGAAVQSYLIHQRIRALAEAKNRLVIAFVEDVAASGGYMVALAADEIIAAPASIVGSIGVVSASFGFQVAIERLGIERRLFATGPYKGMLDPFLPLKADETARLERSQAEVHRQFVDLVRRRRAGRLVEEETDLFSGEFWVGTEAQRLGLVDALGDLRSVMHERFGERVVLRPMQTERGFFGWRPRPSAGLGDVPQAALAALHERALWARFGL